MPATSSKQYKFMQAVKHGTAKGVGPSKEVAEEFISKTPSEKKKLFMKRDKKHA